MERRRHCLHVLIPCGDNMTVHLMTMLLESPAPVRNSNVGCSGLFFTLFTAEPVSDSHNVRLVGGPVENSGRVEIFYGGVWGTVCNIGWDFDDADVVCRQLGYPGAMSLLGDDILREGEGVVWLEGIGCHGNESQLVECGLSGWGESQCNHSMDAGVICEGTHIPLFHFPTQSICMLFFSSACRNAGTISHHHIVPPHIPTRHLSTLAPPSLPITRSSVLSHGYPTCNQGEWSVCNQNNSVSHTHW